MEGNGSRPEDPALDTAYAGKLFDGLVGRGRFSEGKRASFMEKLSTPESAGALFDRMSERGMFSPGKKEEFMRKMYPGLNGTTPWEDGRGPSVPGYMEATWKGMEAAEEQTEKEREERSARTEALLREVEAAKPALQAASDERQKAEINTLTADVPDLQELYGEMQGERARRDVQEAWSESTGDPLGDYEKRVRRNEARMSDIQENLAYIDGLETKLEGMRSEGKTFEEVPVPSTMDNVPSGTAGVYKPENEYNVWKENAPALRRMEGGLSGVLEQAKSDTRRMQQEYAEQQISDLDLLLGAAALKVGGTFSSEDKGREAMAEALAGTMSREEASRIWAEQAVIRDAQRNLQRMYKAASVDPEGSGWNRFWQGMSAAFDGGRGLLTLGLSDVSEGIRALQALKRVEAGEGSAADRALVESLADKADAEGLLEGGKAYNIGQGLYGSLEFMLDMAVTGGLAAGIRKSAGKAAGKAVSGATKAGLERFAGSRAGKTLAKGTDMVAGSALSPMTMQGTVERQRQNYMYGRDGQGDLVVEGVSAPEGLFRSYANAFGSNFISRFTERAIGPFAEKHLLNRVFRSLKSAGQKFTPKFLRDIDNLGGDIGRVVRDMAGVQGFTGEMLEELVEQPLQYWLVQQTALEKELGVEKAWSNVYGDGFFLETFATVALMQGLFSLPTVAGATGRAVDNRRMMRRHLSALDEGTAKELKRVMALEDDNERAQALAGLLRDAGSGQARMDILGYAVSRTANNLGMSWRRAMAQGAETEEYRQTLLAVSTDGESVTVAVGRDGNRYAVKPGAGGCRCPSGSGTWRARSGCRWVVSCKGSGPRRRRGRRPRTRRRARRTGWRHSRKSGRTSPCRRHARSCTLTKIARRRRGWPVRRCRRWKTFPPGRLRGRWCKWS